MARSIGVTDYAPDPSIVEFTWDWPRFPERVARFIEEGALPTDWFLVAIVKPTGVSFGKLHKYNFAAGTWQYED